MINFECANKYCCEDITLIENYSQAVADNTQTWHCHHRLETDLGLTRDELIKQNKYFKVPASELIFLTRAEHNILHKTGKNLSEETKKKTSESMKGKNNPMYGIHRTWMNNGIVEVLAKTQEDIDHYHELGYQFGRK